jgi:hypothetical protein
MIMVSKRNLSMTLDHAHGETFSAIAKKYGVSTPRACQVYKETLYALGILDEAGVAAEVGLYVQRREADLRRRREAMTSEDICMSTPVQFFREVESERKCDRESFLIFR